MVFFLCHVMWTDEDKLLMAVCANDDNPYDYN